jgi:hypothetical protein
MPELRTFGEISLRGIVPPVTGELRPHPALRLGIASGATIAGFTQFVFAFNEFQNDAAHSDLAIGACHQADCSACGPRSINQFERHQPSPMIGGQGTALPVGSAWAPGLDSIPVKRPCSKNSGRRGLNHKQLIWIIPA